MSLTNTSRSYGTVTKSFHWIIALLIFTVIPLGWVGNTLAYDIRNPDIPTTDADVARVALLFSIHKTIGVAIFFIALGRIIWALGQTKPGLLNADKKLEATAAEIAHWLLYGSLVAVPLSGWIHHAAATGFAPIWWPFSQNLFFVPKSQPVADFFGSLHWVLVWVMIATLAAHIGGALKHFVIDRDFTLQRMLPGFGEGPETKSDHSISVPLIAAVAVWVIAIGGGAALGKFEAHGAQDASHDSASLEEVQSDWQVQDGTLAIDVIQMGSAVSGSFADWTAAITFEDPDAPGPAGNVSVTVNIASLSLGTVSDQAMGPDFFNTEAFPTATFVAEIVKTDTGYEASGPLTIKGVSVPATLPFTLDLDGDTAVMEGALGINRLDFNVGESMQDEGGVGFPVEIKVNLTASRS